MKKLLGWCLRVVAGLAVLLALFHLEENWRGKRAWEQWKAAQEAKGVHYDPASFAPAAIPDSDNFAKAPVVEDAISGRKALLPGFHWPNPTPSFPQWRLGQQMDLLQWRRAFNAEDFESSLAPWQAQLDALDSASRRPGCRLPLKYSIPEVLDNPLISMSSVRSATRLLQLRAIERLQRGEATGALQDVLIILRVARHMQSEPNLVPNQVQSFLLRNALPPIWEGLANHCWNRAQLIELETAIQGIDLVASYRKLLENERVLEAGLGTRLLEHSPSTWALARDSTVEFQDMDESGGLRPHRLRTLRTWLLIPKGWRYQNLMTDDRGYATTWLPAVDAGRHRIDAGTLRELPGRAEMATVIPYNWRGRVVMPTLVQMASNIAERQSAMDEALIACALERYRLDKGAYPASVKALIPAYLSEVPRDVVNGQLLHYHANPDGTFTLYSVGWDVKDDGGQAKSTSEGTLDIEHGDWPWPSPRR